MKITIITGKQGTGKSLTALKLAGVKNTLVVYSLSNIKEADINTSAIIIEEHVFKRDMATLVLFSSQEITFRPPYSKTKISICPHLIFVAYEVPEWLNEYVFELIDLDITLNTKI